MARSLDFHRKQPSRQPDQPPKERRRERPSLMLSVVLLALAAVIISSWYANATSGEPPASPSPSATPTPTTTPPAAPSATPTSTSPISSLSPEPTPLSTPSETPSSTSSPTPSEAALTKEQLALRILNGSGTAGKANTLRGELVAKGYPVRLIAVAQTRRASTIIYHTPEAKELAEEIKAGMTEYTVTLEENSQIVGDDHILIIVGTK